MTRGEEVIRPDFAKNDEVKEVKVAYAKLFDLILKNFIPAPGKSPEEDKKIGEINRLVVRSLEDLEISAMFAVKALTV